MHTYQLAIYTASDIVMEAVPFLVEGRVNRIIPKASGIYVLLHDTSQTGPGRRGCPEKIMSPVYPDAYRSLYRWLLGHI